VPVAAPSVIRPAFLSTPPSATGSLGDEAADLAAQLGQQVDEEERIALRALMPVKADGMPAGLEAGIVCGRRQVKSWALEMTVVHDSFVTKVPRAVWSAHLTDTSDQNFNHLTALIESYDWLRKRVRRVYRGNGDHRILMTDGRSIEFMARESGKQGRGRDVNRLILDEWLYGTPAMLGAMVPMLGGVNDRYIRYGSSPGLPRSDSLRELRDRGRRGGDPSLSWAEWTSERMVDGKRVLPLCEDAECTHRAGVAVGCFLDDYEIRRSVNPAYGRRLTEEFVEQERLALPPMEYMRERCGIWEDPPPEGDEVDTILENWPRCEDKSAAPGDPIALGVAVSYNLRAATIVACGLGADGIPVLEVIDYRKAGTGWVAKRLEELRSRHNVTAVGVVAYSPASSLLPVLPDDVQPVPGVQFAGACSALVQDINDGRIRHRGQTALEISVANAVRRFAGDGWRWSLKQSPEDISPLIGAVVARHLLATTDAAPPYDPLANFMP
jgi:hypothetical protein